MTLDPHLDGYAQDIEPGAGLAVGPGGDKVVLHSTETGPGTFNAVRNMWRGPANWGKGLPHFLMEGSRIVQLLPLTVNAYTMENKAGGTDTNRSGHVIQIEIVHRAGQPLSDEQYEVLGKWLADLKRAGLDFDLENHPEFYNAGCGWTLAAYNAKQRFAAEKWTAGRFWAAHQHAPENCVSVDAKVLREDLTWVTAGEVRVGDRLVAFDDKPKPGSRLGRAFRYADVTHEGTFEAPGFRVTTSKGSIVTTANHPWLVRLPYVSQGKRVDFVETRNLDPGRHLVYSVGDPWEALETRDAGYLAGLIDADGHVTASRGAGTWIGFGQVPGDILDLFLHLVEDLGGLWTTARFLGQVRPLKLSRLNLDGAHVGKTAEQVKVLSVEPCGVSTFAALTTSTGTYLADGYLMHNSHWDLPLDGDRLEAIARSYLDGAPAPTLPLEEDDPMFCVLKNRDTGEHFVWAVGAARPQKVGAVVAQNLSNTGKALLGNGAPFEVDGAFLASIETPINVAVSVGDIASAKAVSDEIYRRMAS